MSSILRTRWLPKHQAVRARTTFDLPTFVKGRLWMFPSRMRYGTVGISRAAFPNVLRYPTKQVAKMISRASSTRNRTLYKDGGFMGATKSPGSFSLGSETKRIAELGSGFGGGGIRREHRIGAVRTESDRDDSRALLQSFQALWDSPVLSSEGQVGDGREQALLKFVLESAEESPESVLATIDRFSRKSFLMNVGDEKGAVLARTVADVKPVAALELGSYVGYSAVTIASKLQAAAKLICVEMSPSNANITRRVVEHAGLKDKVEVVDGVLGSKLEEVTRLVHKQGRKSLDLVFIDHFGDYYLPDFLTLKEQGLICPGTVVVADNMGHPGPLDFQDFLAKHGDEYETVKHEMTMEYLNNILDDIWVITCK